MKIKAAHLREFLNQYHREEITFSMMVHKLNEVASAPETKEKKVICLGQKPTTFTMPDHDVVVQWVNGSEYAPRQINHGQQCKKCGVVRSWDNTKCLCSRGAGSFLG